MQKFPLLFYSNFVGVTQIDRNINKYISWDSLIDNMDGRKTFNHLVPSLFT